MNTKIVFCCPNCRKALQLGDEVYKCLSCQRVYPIIQNIPIFSEQSNYYGEIKRQEMTQLLRDASSAGFEKALKDYLKDPFVYKYVIDESRAKWIEIIPHNKNTRFLDVGCGWGTNAIPISRRVKELVALDATYERVKFVEIRANQSNAENVVPVLGSAIKLPFPDESFDVVAFNGVLEWVGAIDKTIDPLVIQKQVLSEAHRVLAPNGRIYIGIENRFSLRYFLGGPDDHSFLRFTSLLPRKLANIYSKLRTGDQYYTHTHSLKAYYKLLNETSFSNILSFFPWPTYRNPEVILPLEIKAILMLFDDQLKSARPMSRKWLYLTLLRLITMFEKKGRFCHSFCFIAEK